MQIRALWGTCLLAGTLSAAAWAEALTPAVIAEKATPSMVLIQLADGLGSGFVVSDDGRIATNAHVIRGAKKLKIVAADGREFSDPELMAVDESHDLALLRIGAHGLAALPLADSDKTRPGERVVAIGHPLGLGNTVSDGLVSAIRQLSPEQTLLQISAPISPGSSGGPLFNDRGEVIGISTLVIAGGQNLNFAVPINVLKPLLAIRKGTALAAYEWPAPRRRSVPRHPLSLLDDCPAPQLQALVKGIAQAIDIGAPLYNEGNIEACYRVYAAAALDLDKTVAHCAGPRRALLDGVGKADRLEDWDGKAWAMRDAFDGVLQLAERQARGGDDDSGQQRQVPHHPASVLADCAAPSSAAIKKGIAAAIHSGAPLYNAGNIEACYRIYEGAISDIERQVPGCGAAKQALQSGVKIAAQRTGWSAKAWALRDAFDGMLELIERQKPASK